MPSSRFKEGGDQTEKHDFWMGKFEEKAREMRAIEEPKINLSMLDKHRIYITK
jgi:hypothetical protein